MWGGGVSGVCRDRISCLDCIGMSVLVAVEVSLGSIEIMHHFVHSIGALPSCHRSICTMMGKMLW